MTLLVLRPDPGNAATCARAEALGFRCLSAPIFEVQPIAWSLPDSVIDAVMLTSANAVRHAGDNLAALIRLPAFAVGHATAEAAEAAGFADVRSAEGDAVALLALVEAAGPKRALHLVGREHVALDSDLVAIERRIVYGADPVATLPPIPDGAVALLHSARAAAHFATLLHDAGIARESIAVAAISGAAATAAGPGWRDLAVAAAPDDDALLAAAARLCED